MMSSMDIEEATDFLPPPAGGGERVRGHVPPERRLAARHARMPSPPASAPPSAKSAARQDSEVNEVAVAGGDGPPCMAEWLQANRLSIDDVRWLLGESSAGACPGADHGAPEAAGLDAAAAWKVCANALGRSLPELGGLVGNIRDEAPRDLEPSPGKDPRAFTLDRGTGVLPHVSLHYGGSAADLLAVAHEFAHALQIVASEGSPTPPVVRECCAFLGELMLLRYLRANLPATFGTARKAWESDNDRYLGEDRDRLEEALSVADEPYRYRWNYPMARVLAQDLFERKSADEVAAIFCAGAETPDLLNIHVCERRASLAPHVETFAVGDGASPKHLASPELESRPFVRAASAQDVERLLPALRRADRVELEALRGRSAEAEVRASLAAAARAWAIEWRGEVVGLFGVSPKPDAAVDVGRPWMMASDELYRIGFRFLKECGHWVAEMQSGYRVLTNHVDARNAVAIRWLKWLGFEFTRRCDGFGVNGEAFWEFRRERNVGSVVPAPSFTVVGSERRSRQTNRRLFRHLAEGLEDRMSLLHGRVQITFVDFPQGSFGVDLNGGVPCFRMGRLEHPDAELRLTRRTCLGWINRIHDLDFRQPGTLANAGITGDLGLLLSVGQALLRPSPEAEKRLAETEETSARGEPIREIPVVSGSDPGSAAQLLAQRQPFLFRECFRGWDRWNRERLERDFAEVVVAAGPPLRQVALGDFFKAADTAHREGRRFGSPGHPLPSAFRAHFRVRPLSGATLRSPALWIGTNPTDVPFIVLHREVTIGLLIQMVGRSRISLHPPHFARHLLPVRAFNTFQPCLPDPAGAGGSGGTREERSPLALDLNPGDGVCIPVGWFCSSHSLGSLEMSVRCAVHGDTRDVLSGNGSR